MNCKVDWINLGPSERHDNPLEKVAGDSISQDRVLSTGIKEKQEGEGREGESGTKAHTDDAASAGKSFVAVCSMEIEIQVFVSLGYQRLVDGYIEGFSVINRLLCAGEDRKAAASFRRVRT